MSRMTLAEKIGQMTQRVAVATADVLRDYSTGSILSGGGRAPLFNFFFLDSRKPHPPGKRTLWAQVSE